MIKMPKINRIRIANIQYDKKIIKDLMLNCYSGENVLLNLANGGGKSVLVQLMGQPIMPESKIHGREVYSYLSPDQPSYILIEWKLDNTEKTYLLTGIVMSKQLSSDDMNKTKYFTFINEYKKSNEFDIKNIPFIEKQENVTIYKSFETANKLINENKNIESLRTFGRQDQREYRKKLAEYGIFANEWKLLSKINENEGGVDELFKDCKTSDSLVNKWILKTISDSNEAEGKELREMFVSLMQEIIEKESNIKEKETLEKFKKEIQEYEEVVKDLTEKLNEEKEVEININNMYLNLQKLSQENQQKIEQIENQILQNEKDLQQIDYEEISEEYYKKQSDLEAIREEKDKKQEELEIQKQNLEKAKYEYKLQKVAYIHEKEKEATAKIQALEQARTNLQNKNGTDNEIIQIEYNLQEQYKKEEQKLQESLNKIEQENKQIKENISKWKIQKEQTQKNIAEYSNKIGSIQQKIEQFKQEEKNVFQKMNIMLTRNLLNELEEKEVQKINESLEKQEQDLKTKIQENEEQIQLLSKNIKEANEKQEENNEKIEELTSKHTQKNIQYKEFLEKEEEIKQILKYHRIEESIYQKQVYEPIIKEKYLENKRKLEEQINKINKVKETLTDLQEGRLHNSKQIREILEKENIEYITGEEYLKKQQEKYQKELLEKNPILPYCYIVTKEDLEKIKKLDIKEETNKIAPIITYENIDKVMQKEKQIIKVEEIYLLSLYHKECFSENANQYKEKLEEQLENYKIRKEDTEKQVNKIKNHLEIVSAFNYEEKDKKEIEEEKLSLERQIKDKKEENQNHKENKEKWEQEIENKKYENQEKSEQLKENKQQKEDFLKYIENNTYYMENEKEKQNCENQIETNTKENENIENKIEEADKKSKENVVNKSSLTHKLEEITEKQIKIPKREEGTLLNISIEELEAKYEILNNEYKQNMDEINKELANWNKIKEEKAKERQKDYGDLREEDYISIIYSEEMEDLAKEKKEEEENELEEVRKIADNKINSYIRIETQFQETNNNLKKIGKEEPISASQIKGNYEKRRENIKEANQEGRKNQKEYMEKNKKITYQINEIARKIDIKNIEQELQKIEIEKVDLQELLSKYTQLKKENQINKDISYRKNLEINNNYKNKHRIINTFLENVKIQDGQAGTFETYYHIYEKIGQSVEKLTEYIAIVNLSLQNIEKDKKNILEHAIKQGKMLYEEMKKISESSRIKIGERYVQILKIDIPQELKDYVEKRIENHIETCIQDLREECKSTEDITKTIESKVMTQLSDRKLLNLTLDIETIKVKLYKFDIENKNSGLRQWEEVIVENSGGQKFIACFALLSALTQYTRKKELENMGEDEKAETSKVFILDNPFGKTSSKHLLEPMLEISKRFNTQMICLSDLSQSSITDKFTLIYQLALRSSKYTNNSFLNIEDARINGDVAVDTSLEQVYLRSNVEQLNLFE